MTLPPLWVVSALAAAVISGAAAWFVTDLAADNEMLVFQKSISEANDAKREAERKLADARELLTRASSSRIDTKEVEQKATETIVHKEVIRYVQNPAYGKCVLPADWVREYNRAHGMELPSAD